MTTNCFAGLGRAKGWLLAMLVIALAGGGCATRKIDWSQRVGVYTFDQAIEEFGPPDKQAELSDKSLVCEWLTRRGYAYNYPAYGYSPYYGPVYPVYRQDYAPDRFLRLTFDPDRKLTVWKSFSK